MRYGSSQSPSLQALNAALQQLAMVKAKKPLPPKGDTRGLRRSGREQPQAVKDSELSASGSDDDNMVQEPQDVQLSSAVGSIMEHFVPFKFHLDLLSKTNSDWLHAIGLKPYADLSWAAWEENIYAPTQLALLKKTAGVLKGGTKVTPSLISHIFHLPHFPDIEAPTPASDEDMQKEFGAPVGTRNYFQLRSVSEGRRD